MAKKPKLGRDPFASPHKAQGSYDDYYEWLKDNYKSFFHSLPQNNPDWNWIRERIEYYSKD